jgi:hypothetical protein
MHFPERKREGRLKRSVMLEIPRPQTFTEVCTHCQPWKTGLMCHQFSETGLCAINSSHMLGRECLALNSQIDRSFSREVWVSKMLLYVSSLGVIPYQHPSHHSQPSDFLFFIHICIQCLGHSPPHPLATWQKLFCPYL